MSLQATTHPIPFHLWKSEIAAHLVALGVYDQAWFQSQTNRIALYRDSGESLDGAKAMMAAFAAGRREAALADRLAKPVKPFAFPSARAIATKWVRQ